jgi:hypothetical protein
MGIVKNIWDGYTNLALGRTTPFERQRVLICKKCEFYKKGTSRWCAKCPCIMPAKVKSSGAKCKIGKW